jgi:Family of unknown function (DUF6941)
MRLRLGLLADYAAVGQSGKLTVVHMFGVVGFPPNTPRPITLPVFYLVVVFEADVWEGTEHNLTIGFLDEDGKVVVQPRTMALKFRPTFPGRPLEASLILQCPGIQVAEPKDYVFTLDVDGKPVDRVPVYVREQAAQP